MWKHPHSKVKSEIFCCSNPRLVLGTPVFFWVKSQPFSEFYELISHQFLWLGEAAYWHQSLIFARHEHPRFCWKSMEKYRFHSIPRKIFPQLPSCDTFCQDFPGSTRWNHDENLSFPAENPSLFPPGFPSKSLVFAAKSPTFSQKNPSFFAEALQHASSRRSRRSVPPLDDTARSWDPPSDGQFGTPGRIIYG